MRRRYVQLDGVLHEVTDEGLVRDPKAPMVMPDIQPYQSMIDGSMITSRSQHRDHLRQHGCIEIGNETKHHLDYYKRLDPYNVAPQQRKELIRAQFDAMSHREFKAALKRDIDSVKWNSRKD